ncbi:hypothetical protein BOTU111921_22965 [Bordetella tumbae]|uniref:hypothetical protein n=1 Tax=Bordetella tumbae TaxID=1649139 RepID=UPI0039EED988
MADDSLRSDLANASDPTKGAALVGYIPLLNGSTGRMTADKLLERVSVLDFGAIGDGVSRPLSTIFATLALAQQVYPHATALSDELDWAAFQAALNLGKTKGGLTIYCPGTDSIYVFGENVLSFGSNAKGIRFIGDGGVLRFRRYGGTANLINGANPHDVELRNFRIEGGQLGLTGNAAATDGQGISFASPKNCIADRLFFTDTRGFALLWYNNNRDSATDCSNNLIIDCGTDGAGVASSSFLFANLSDSMMIRPTAKNNTGTSDDTAYTFDLKNNCINCSILDFIATNCRIAVVLSDDSSSGFGIGAKNSRITGTAYNCGAAMSTNKASGTYASVTMVGCGSGTSGALAIAGFNTRCTYDLVIHDTPADANAIYSGSPDQQFNISRYDNSGLWLFSNNGSAARNEINIMGGPNRTSGLANIQARINSINEATFPRVLDMRDLPNPVWNAANTRWDSTLCFPMPGGSRTANALTMRSTGDITLQSQANVKLLYSSSSETWRIPNGVPEYADDAAASAGGLAIGSLYRTDSIIKIRVT